MSVQLAAPILIVDDYDTMIRIVRNLLRQMGFTAIDEANDGASALRKLKQRRYQCVISDWNMSPMTGAELVCRIRADEMLAQTPVVVVAGEGRADAHAAAQADRTSEIIVKPFNAQSLKQKLTALLGDF